MASSEIVVDLIRHAHSNMNAAMEDPTQLPFIGGRQNDVDLDEQGEREAALLGKYASRHDLTPDIVFSSPAVRALRTCRIALDVMGLTVEPIIDFDLQELDQGSWTQQPRSLYDLPENAQAMLDLKGDFRPPNGESMNDVARRMQRFSESLQARAESETFSYTWAFTHGVAIKTLLGKMLGWSHTKTYMLQIPNASRTQLVLKDGIWHCEFVGQSTQD